MVENKSLLILNRESRHAWKVFFSIVLKPQFLIFFGLTMVSIYFSVFYPTENKLFLNLMTIVSSILGGVVGALFHDEYKRLTGEMVLQKKGRSAWRNLKDINTQLCNIDRWVSAFIKQTIKKENKRNFEEIQRHLTSLQLNIVSGIEDWVDIVPELSQIVKRNVEIDQEYLKIIEVHVEELMKGRKELALSKDKSKTKKLKERVDVLENEIRKISKERSKFFNVGAGDIITTSSGTIFTGNDVNTRLNFNDNLLLDNTLSRRCSQCGKIYFADNLSTTNTSYCNECQNGVLVRNIDANTN